MLDIRTAQTEVEDAVRDAVLYALGHRIASVASVAALRDFVTRGANGETVMHDDKLAAVTVASVTTGYRWNSQSTAADNGTSVVKPDDVSANGRWLRYTSPLRISLAPGEDSQYLHELTSGPLQRVIVLDQNMDADTVNKLVFGQVPSVLIEATDDVPQDMTLNAGHRYDDTFHFTISVIAQNLRDRRQAAQGSSFSGEDARGANGIDGLIQSLLGGTRLYGVLPGIRNVQVGRAYNWTSEQAQRRVIRGRAYAIVATVVNPPAENDYGPVEQINAQAHMTAAGEPPSEWDEDNVVTSGLDVPLGAGLSRTVRAGTALLDGEEVTFAGEVHAFSASRVTYRDLAEDGTMTYVETGLSSPAPDVTDNCLRIGVTTTDASGVVADHFIARTSVLYGANNQIPIEE